MSGGFEPRNPDYAAVVRASFAAQGALRAVGAVLESVTPGACTIRLPYSDAATQQHGFFHGGVIGMLADVAGGYAAMSLLPPGWEVLSVEYKINFVAPAEGCALRASGRVLRAGRTLLVTAMDVVTVDESGAERACAVAQQTIMALGAERVRR